MYYLRKETRSLRKKKNSKTARVKVFYFFLYHIRLAINKNINLLMNKSSHICTQQLESFVLLVGFIIIFYYYYLC